MDLNNYFDEFTQRDWQTQTTGTIRLAMIGVGWWTRDRAIPGVKRANLCETTVLVSGSEEKASRVAAKHQIPTTLTYEEFHNGAASDEYDAVYIATPNATHLPYVQTAASHGKAILCEKPMESTVERAEQVVELTETASVPFMVAYRLQTQPAARRARELIRDGFIGDPLLIHANLSQDLLSMIPDECQWRLQPAMAGYGTTLMDIGIYQLNTARFLLESDPTTVHAMMNSPDSPFADVPDEHAAFTCHFENGVHMAATASQHAYGDTHLEVIGTDGLLRLSPAFSLECDLTLSRAGTEAAVSFEQVDEMTEEFDYFADRVLSGRAIHSDGRHGVTDMRVLAGLYKAGRTGEQVKLGTN